MKSCFYLYTESGADTSSQSSRQLHANDRTEPFLWSYWAWRVVLSVPLDPVELPRRPGIRLCVLSAHRQPHRVPLANVAANHALVGDVLPHLALQVRLDPQPAQRIHPLRLLSREWRGRRVELRKVRPGTRESLQWRRWRGRLECRRGERRAWRDGGCGGRGEESGNGGQLRRVELAHATGVVDLQAGTDAAGGVATDPIEVG